MHSPRGWIIRPGKRFVKFLPIYESSGERSLLMRIVRRGVGRAGRAHSSAFCRSVASCLVCDRLRQSIVDPFVLPVGIAKQLARGTGRYCTAGTIALPIYNRWDGYRDG